MDANARLGALVEVLQRDGRVDVAEMAAGFGTAEMTIRRDLDRIVAMGMARRVRGGAISLLMRGEELPFAMRVLEHAEAKGRIAAAVAEALRDGEAVLLDSGTTAVLVGRELASRRLTVMPMSLHAASVLAAHESIRLLMPGGETRPGELAMTGPLALGEHRRIAIRHNRADLLRSFGWPGDDARPGRRRGEAGHDRVGGAGDPGCGQLQVRTDGSGPRRTGDRGRPHHH